MYLTILYVSLESGCELSAHSLTDLAYLPSAWITQRRILKSWSSSVPWTEEYQKVWENGRQLLSPFPWHVSVTGAVPPPLTVDPICSSFAIWKEHKSVSTGQFLRTGDERARARQREIFHLVNAASSTFGSHCLHFRSCHSPLSLFFVLFLIHLFPLLKTKLSYLHW